MYLHSMHTNTRPFPLLPLWRSRDADAGHTGSKRRATVVACGVLGWEKETSSDVFNWGNAKPTRRPANETRRRLANARERKGGKKGRSRATGTRLAPDTPPRPRVLSHSIDPHLDGHMAIVPLAGQKTKSKQINKKRRWLANQKRGFAVAMRAPPTEVGHTHLISCTCRKGGQQIPRLVTAGK